MAGNEEREIFQINLDDTHLFNFLHDFSLEVGKPLVKDIRERLFDIAQEILNIATDMAPHRTGKLTASILAHGIRGSKGGRARRGFNKVLVIGATQPYAEVMHEGFDDGAYFLGIGRQTKSDRGNATKRTAFRTPRADLSSESEVRFGWKLKGSVAKNQKTGKVGWKYLERAVNEKSEALGNWQMLDEKKKEKFIKLIAKSRRRKRRSSK